MIRYVFFVLDAGWFGHTRTAASVISKFAEKGCDVAVVIDASRKSNYISKTLKDQSKVRFYYIGMQAGRFPVKKLLQSKEFNMVELVHSFEDCGLFEIISATSALGKKHVSTVCAPLKKHNYFPVRNTVFLSDEFMETSRRLSKVVNLFEVIRCRVSPESLSRSCSSEKDVRAALNQFLDQRIKEVFVLRVCQVSAKYLPGLFSIIEAVGELVDAGLSIKFLHVGDGGHEAAASLKAKMEEVNNRLGQRCVYSTDVCAPEAHLYMRFADIVVGSGRSAFEALFYKKPCVVVDMSGAGGALLFSSLTARHLAYYNFSGRNNEHNEYHKSISATIAQLVDERSGWGELTQYGREYFDSNLSDEILLSKYLDFYAKAEHGKYSYSYWLFYGAKYSFLRIIRLIKSLL